MHMPKIYDQQEIYILMELDNFNNSSKITSFSPRENLILKLLLHLGTLP